MSRCTCTEPGICPFTNRRVRWADIHSCRGTMSTSSSRVPDCRNCSHAGPIIVNAEGKPVGTSGCGCTAESQASGDTWLTCETLKRPVRAVKARNCLTYHAKGK